MTTKKKQTVILITATTLGMSNISNSYVFVHAQDAPAITHQQAGISDKIYDEHGNLLINELTFPDPYFREYVNRALANNAGFFTQEELAYITEVIPVDADGTTLKNLSSVAGIEYFPNLSILNLFDTGLTTLDVSKNTELKELSVAYTPLKVLELRYNRKLTAVDATGVQLAYFYWGELENKFDASKFKIDSYIHHTIYSLSSTVDLTKIYPGLDPSKMYLDSGETFQEGKLSNFKYDTRIKFIIDTALNEVGDGRLQAVQGEIYFTIKEGLAIDDINFPDQEFQQYVRQFDTDTDGIFNQAELDAVTVIYVRGNKDIDDLQGIEHFANLTSLDCSQTNISALDVHNNKNLRVLYCFKTKINELDINENKLLETLGCYDNEELDTLEISGATALKTLNCNSTNIGTLNTQENINLESLECGYTPLGSLKIEKNEKLTYLGISNTSIQNLDISKQKLLETLIISSNDIDTLNISHLHNLNYLNISNTPIRELNLTQNANLEELYCSNTRLSGLDLSYNNKLSTLDTESSPLIWINFGTSNPNTLTWYNAPPTIPVDTTQPYIDLKNYTGIDINKIDKDSITGGVLHESYLYYNKSGEAVSYMYDAGTVGGVAQKLEVKLIPNEVGVKVDATNFPDPKFLAYVENNIDKNGSGVLTTDEINAVLSINLNNSAYTSVTNIKGMEHFPNLKQLWLENTAISSLETYDLSKITHLSIKNTSIDSLRVENLPNLILLDISGTQIPSLDLTGNTKLETFYGAVSDLTRLDVHGLTSLQTLDVQQSKMFSSLNIEGCSSLTSLYLNRTIIDKLDVSDAINLKNLNIEYTLISNINLQANKILNSLAVGYMENLTDIDLSKNTLLTYLNCSGSPLKRLPLDTNNQLKSLYCTDTQLTSLSLEKNTLLETLVCYNNPGITSLDLRNNTNLKDLQIYGMNLSHLYLGTNDSVNINGGQSSTTSVLQVTVDGPSFDITKILPGIEISRINNFEGADRNGTLIEGYQPNKPITYSYTTNDSTGNPFTLHVTLVLTINPLDRTISFQKDFHKEYDGTKITISSNDIDMLGDKSLLSYTWQKLENNTWVDMNEAPVHAGVYRVSAHAEADDFYKEVSSQPKEVIISQAQNEWTTTPSITEWTYGQYDANKNAPNAAAKFGQYDVTYKDAQGNIVTTTPQNAGAWTMVVSVPETEDYCGISNEVSFTIHKAQAPALVLPENLSAVHGDVLSSIVLPKGWTWVNGQETVSIRKLSYTARFMVDDKNYDYTNVPGYNANGGYVEHEIVLSISKATNTWLKAPFMEDWTYGETAIEPTGKAAYGKVEVSYSNAKDGTFTKDVPTEAGNWFVKLQVPTSVEYTGLEEILSFTIHKAPAPALVLPDNLNAIHSDELSTITLPKGWAWVNGQEIVSVNKTGYAARFTVDDKNYDYSKVAGYNVNGHYVEVELTVVVSKIVNTWTETPFMEDWTYGETAIEPKGKAAHGDVEVTYSNAKDGTFTKDVPTEAGNWFVKLHVPASADYTGLEEIVPFTIKRAVAPALILPENLSAVHGDILSNIVLPNGWTWVDGQEKVSVHKTSYTTRFAVVDDKNYDYSTVPGYDANGHYVERELSVVVSKIVNTWTETPSMDDWTYGEQAIQPIGKAAHGDVEDTYSNAKDGTFTKDVPTEAGNWFVKLQVPSSTEYTGLEEILPFTISKAPAPALVLPENLTALHGDILSNIVLPNGWTWVDGQERVSVHKANYTARFAVVDDKNYDYSKVPGYDVNGHYVEVELSVVVSKLNNTWTETPSMDDWTYGETAKEPKGKAAHGDVEVTYSNAKDGTFTKDIPTEAGNWFVKLHVPASAEYTGLEEILPFTIKRAVAPALILPENLSAAHDDTLSSISLPTGWTWANGQEKVSVHKLSYTARFAVDDKNYDYTNIPGYNANGHYVEHEIVVAVSQGTNTWKVTPSIYDWTYGETAAEPKGEAMHNTTSITYSDKIDGDFTKDVPVQAGNWFMKVSAPASAEYTGIEEILLFTIHKAQAPALKFPENLSAAHDDVLASVSLPTGWAWVNGQEKVSVHKLSYTARFAVDDKNYDYSNVSGYNAGGHYVEVAIQLHVSQANNTWTETPSIANWTYGEAPAQPIGQTTYGDVEVTYSDAMDGTFTKAVPSEAGNWFVKFLVPASAEYAGMEAILPFTIHQAQAPALILPDNLSALHGDALSSIKLPNGWYWVDAQGSVSGNVKTYLARCSVDDKNYDYTAVPGYNASGHYVEVELTILIAQQSNQWIEKPSIADWMYGETPAQPSGKAEHGDVVFTYSDTMDGTYVSEQPTKPGTWYMKARVIASEAYLGLEEIVTFKILPKEDVVKDTDVAQASGLWTIVLASITGLLSCITRKKHRNKK